MNYIKRVNILAVFCLGVVSFSGLVYVQFFVVAAYQIFHLLSPQLLCHYFYRNLTNFCTCYTFGLLFSNTNTAVKRHYVDNDRKVHNCQCRKLLFLGRQNEA